MDWFEPFLELPNGLPSHDTFSRVFARMNSEQYRACVFCCNYEGFAKWVNLAMVPRMRAERRTGEERSCEDRCHIPVAIAFDEDRCQVCKDHGAEKIALLRQIALNMLKQEKTHKQGF